MNRKKHKVKSRRRAIENKSALIARPHIYPEACWFADDPAGFISSQSAREVIRSYDLPRWERLSAAILDKCFYIPKADSSKTRTALRFVDLLFGYLVVTEWEQARQIEHTFGKYTPSRKFKDRVLKGIPYSNAENIPGQSTRKDMPRRKTYWKIARKVFSRDAQPFGIFPLVSVHSCDAKGRAIAADLKTRVMGAMFNDLTSDRYSESYAIQMIAAMWNVLEGKKVPVDSPKEKRQLDSIRRMLLRLPTTKAPK